MAFDAGSLMLRIEAQDKQLLSSLNNVERELMDTKGKMGALEGAMSGGFSAIGAGAVAAGQLIASGVTAAIKGVTWLAQTIVNAGMESIKLAAMPRK